MTTAPALTAAAIFEARRRLHGRILRTPLIRSTWLSGIANADVYLKLESLQPGHSFKLRGAFNALLARQERGDATDRLITASAGNHGRAMAIAARALGLPLTVFTPAKAPANKLNAIRALGAHLEAIGDDYDHAEKLAKEAAGDTGAFVSPYSDADVIAGAGTVGLEILEDLPDVEAIVVPVGGGGLLAGIGLAAEAASDAVEIIGAEVAASPVFSTSLAAGRITNVQVSTTLADGLAGNLDPDSLTFALVQRLADRVVVVREDDLRTAIRGLATEQHLIAEGAGAVGAAALLGEGVNVAGRRVAVVVSGANIDPDRLASFLA